MEWLGVFCVAVLVCALLVFFLACVGFALTAALLLFVDEDARRFSVVGLGAASTFGAIILLNRALNPLWVWAKRNSE